MPMPRKRDNGKKVVVAALAAMLAASFCAGCASADADDPGGNSVLKSAAKVGGFATDVDPPADFVLKSRPASEDYVPIFRPEFVRPHKAKTPAELKALEADFGAVQTRHDAMRSAFPPAAKAVAARKAEQAAKAKPKKLPADEPAPN